MNSVAHNSSVRRRTGPREPIAVVGMACRFPHAPDLESFWELLVNGRSAITEVPTTRWQASDYYDPDPTVPGKMATKWGSFLDGIDEFDAEFFGISPHEAECMDPQQRLLLEVAWEAFEDAGIVPESVRGSSTGTFIGISGNDYARRQLRSDERFEKVGIHTGPGTSPSMAASRLSYFFDLKGPGIAIDTACSSSSSAIHYACRSLLQGETGMALAGGVNLVLAPEGSIALSRSRMMSADGRVKVFDAQADGFVRGEGCGIVILKRLSDAIRDGDRVRAVILSTAINQSGRSNGLTAPSLQAQTAVIADALQSAGVTPSDVQHVEAHGTGTLLGDAIEMKSLLQALGPRSAEDGRCVVSSIKANIGHLEAASGIAALIKIILCLEHDCIPAQISLDQLQRNIDLGHVLEIPRSALPWHRGDAGRIAGMNCFGFGGSNSHITIADPPMRAARSAGQPMLGRSHHLLPLSAHSAASLQALARSYGQFLVDHPEVSHSDLCRSAALTRSSFRKRWSFVAASREDLLAQLRAVCELDAADFGKRRQQAEQPCARIAFVYSDCDGASRGDLDWLSRTDANVRAALRQADAYARAARSVAKKQAAHGAKLGDSSTVHCVIAHYTLTELWIACGIEPRAVMGVGSGQLSAAAVAGLLSWRDAFGIAAGMDRGIAAPDVPGATERCSDARARIQYLPAPGMQASQGMTESGFALCAEKLLTAGMQVILRIAESSAVLGAPKSRMPRGEAQTGGPWGLWLSTLASLHDAGHAVDWKRFYKQAEGARIEAPGVAFVRSKYWYDTPCEAAGVASAQQQLPPAADAPSSGISTGAKGHVDAKAQPVPVAVPMSREVIREKTLGYLSELLPPREEPLSLESSLLELGLDSISTAELANSLQRTLQRPVPLSLFCQKMSINQVIDRLCETSLAPATAALGASPLPLRMQRREGRGPLPLSRAQEQIRRLQRSGAPLQNSVAEIRIRGEYDIERLQQAWLALVARHDALRIVFHEENGRLVQELDGACVPPLRCVAAGRFAEESAGFSLVDGPPASAVLLCESSTHARLLLQAHPLVCDYASRAILFANFAALYSGLYPRKQPTHASSTLPGYLDFLAAHANVFSETEERELLDGLARMSGVVYGTHTFTMPEEIADRLYGLPGMTQSSLRALLVREFTQSVQESLEPAAVAILVVSDGRERLETSNMVGALEHLTAQRDAGGPNSNACPPADRAMAQRRPVISVTASLDREVEARTGALMGGASGVTFRLEHRPRPGHIWRCGEIGFEIFESAESLHCTIHSCPQILEHDGQRALAEALMDRLDMRSCIAGGRPAATECRSRPGAVSPPGEASQSSILF